VLGCWRAGAPDPRAEIRRECGALAGRTARRGTAGNAADTAGSIALGSRSGQPNPLACGLARSEKRRKAGAALSRRIDAWASAHDAAAFLSTDRARIGDIRRGTMKRFSSEMLLRLLVRAGARVEIRVTVPRRGEARASFIDEAKQ